MATLPVLPESPVVYSKEHKTFVFQPSGHKASGLHRFLKDRFYPNYDPKRAIRGHADPDAAKTPRPVKRKKGAKKPPKTTGKRHGVKVDNDIRRGCELINKHKIDIRMLIHAPKAEVVRVHGERLSKTLVKFRQSCKDHSLSAFGTLSGMKLTPVASQYGVGSIVAQRATAVDILCRDSTGSLVAVEVKTGYPDYYRHTGNKLPTPWDAYYDCPYAQHQLQLLGTIALFNSTFPGTPTLKVVDGYIIRMHGNKVSVIHLNKDFSSREPLMRTLVASR